MSNKYNYKGNSIYDREKTDNRVFYWAIVESIDDMYDGNRIKARIKEIDDSKTLSELPYAFPLLQKFIHILPKVGETVMIFAPNWSNPNVDRLYMGPLISQPQYLSKDPELFTSKSLVDSGYQKPDTAPSTIPTAKGVYPTNNQIAVQGRLNTDIIFKDNELLIRVGKFKLDDNSIIPKFNKDNPAFIQLKNDIVIKKNKEKDILGTVTNVVANKINLITHEDGSPRFKLNDQEHQITDEEILNIIDTASPMVKGDKLAEILKLMRNAFANHVHRYHGSKAEDLAGSKDIDKYLEYDIDSILSKNIKLN